MKISLLLVTILFLTTSFAQTTVFSKTNGELKFVELDYGLAKVVRGKEEELRNSPTGSHGWLKDFVITKVTDSVQAVINNNFGVVYMVKAKDSVNIDVVIEWIYPEKITNQKGEVYKSFKYSTKRPTNIPSASSYTFEEPFEMVKGDWQMNIYLEDKKVYSKTFIVY